MLTTKGFVENSVENVEKCFLKGLITICKKRFTAFPQPLCELCVKNLYFGAFRAFLSFQQYVENCV